uniref:Oxidized purine nucleoside triphosphate hydrolase n=1 Tax=Branchiostoma floridae TaxID=7739 RepID=C3ZJU9_BRAFL|eukprot:XP_002591223.1 hypothetical protein BRAFLDRAFT_249348 [Branchiostoma floridae]
MSIPVHLSRKVLTLVLIRHQQQVLLGMKKRGFGAGRWNGFGGKVEMGETIEQAAKRELEEESCLRVDSLQKVGLLLFEFVGDPVMLEVHVFSSRHFTGEPRETEEMRPKWFPVEHIPYDSMWPDDIHWFPLFLKGSKFSGFFKFKGHNTILEHSLQELDTLPQ